MWYRLKKYVAKIRQAQIICFCIPAGLRWCIGWELQIGVSSTTHGRPQRWRGQMLGISGGQERQERCQCLELTGVMCFRVPTPRVVDLYHLARYSNMPKIRLLKTGNSLKIVTSVGAAGARDIWCHHQAWLPKGMEARWVLWERESNGGGHLSSKLPPWKNVGEIT